MSSQKEAPGDNRGHIKSTDGRIDRINPTTTIEQGKRAFNVIHQGKRIASFLCKSRAIQFAKEML